MLVKTWVSDKLEDPLCSGTLPEGHDMWFLTFTTALPSKYCVPGQDIEACGGYVTCLELHRWFMAQLRLKSLCVQKCFYKFMLLPYTYSVFMYVGKNREDYRCIKHSPSGVYSWKVMRAIRKPQHSWQGEEHSSSEHRIGDTRLKSTSITRTAPHWVSGAGDYRSLMSLSSVSPSHSSASS